MVALLFWSNRPQRLEVDGIPGFPVGVSLFSGKPAAFSSHQAEILIVKHLIQGRNKVTRMRIEPRSCNQVRRKKDPFTYVLFTLPTNLADGIVTFGAK